MGTRTPGGEMSAIASKAATHFKLGRVSNLPTVWTNVIAGAALGGGSLAFGGIVSSMFAISLFYVGGMYLNDAFDERIDRVERPERPIPSGVITSREVFRYGFMFLGAGLAVLTLLVVSGVARVGAVVTAGILGLAVVLYDAWHKSNPISPVL